jgi:ankyrin repeat protein
MMLSLLRAFLETLICVTYCKCFMCGNDSRRLIRTVYRMVHGASPHSVDLEGNTPLHCALHCKYEAGPETNRKLARLFLNFGADPKTETTKEKNNALHKLFITAGRSEADLVLAYTICEHRKQDTRSRKWFGTDLSTHWLLNAQNADGLTAYEVCCSDLLTTFSRDVV